MALFDSVHMQDRAFDHGTVDFLHGRIEEVERKLRETVVGFVISHYGQDGRFYESLNITTLNLWIYNPVCQIFRSQIVAFASSEEPCGVGAGTSLRDRMVPREQFPRDGARMRNAEDYKSFDQIRILPGE